MQNDQEEVIRKRVRLPGVFMDLHFNRFWLRGDFISNLRKYFLYAFSALFIIQFFGWKYGDGSITYTINLGIITLVTYLLLSIATVFLRGEKNVVKKDHEGIVSTLHIDLGPRGQKLTVLFKYFVIGFIAILAILAIFFI